MAEAILRVNNWLLVWMNLCLEVNTYLHCLELLRYFFIHVSVSNLHFPQMKLASENPPEARNNYTEHYNTQLLCNKQCFIQCWTFYWCCDDINPYHTVMRFHNHVVWLVYLPFLTLYVVNLCIHFYSGGKLTIRMVHVHIALHCHL